MNYRLEDISADDFEKLVNTLCQKILGIGIVDFSKGRDGGRDGRLTGRANEYPTKAEPWNGRFIIQAKHTEDYKASCSDKTFHGNKTSLVNGEIDKLNKLISKNETIDNYLIFTNRKETENRENAIEHIKSETGLINVDIIGKDTIHRWISQYDDIAKQFKLGLYALPLQLTEFDIKEVIIAFGKQVNKVSKIKPITSDDIFKNKEGKGGKNELNMLSANYYNNQIKNKSLQYFSKIDDFLQNNDDLTNIYFNFAYELSHKIDIKRDTFGKFEEVFMYLYDLIFEANKIDLKKDRRLIWIFLHHLYFNCHIGRTT